MSTSFRQYIQIEKYKEKDNTPITTIPKGCY